jgi:hypothetical protein
LRHEQRPDLADGRSGGLGVYICCCPVLAGADDCVYVEAGMSKEAMKLALEALEYLCKPILHGWEAETQKEKRDKAITALREALAEQPAQQETIKQGWDVDTLLDKPKQPAQDVPEVGFGNTALDKMAENARKLGLDYEPAQQEPVVAIRALTDQCFALIQERDELQKQVWRYEKNGVTCQTYRHKVDASCAECNVHEVYTSPPAQRTWVGLTDEEVQAAVYDENGCVVDYENYAEAIEAKLKEKNT